LAHECQTTWQNMEMDTGKFRIYRILEGGIDTSLVEIYITRIYVPMLLSLLHQIIGNFLTGILLILKKPTCFGWNTIKSIRIKRKQTPERDTTPEQEEMWSDKSIQLRQPRRNNRPSTRRSILKPDSRRSSISRSFSDIFNPDKIFRADRKIYVNDFQMVPKFWTTTHLWPGTVPKHRNNKYHCLQRTSKLNLHQLV